MGVQLVVRFMSSVIGLWGLYYNQRRESFPTVLWDCNVPIEPGIMAERRRGVYVLTIVVYSPLNP